MRKYYFERAYLTEGTLSRWHKNVLITVDDSGMIAAVEPDACAGQTEKMGGFAVPGIPNSHSHAFQKALAGRTEFKAAHQDNFWGWRQLMYQFANAITPEDMAHIAAYLYLDMLKSGYTAVAEFHYLHHQPGGQAYDDPAEMSRAILQAAEAVGLGLTLLPVLYMEGGFDHRPLEPHQMRFGHDPAAYLRLLDSLSSSLGAHQNLGVAFHSLRAVPATALTEVMAAIDHQMPVHIHISEQTSEVEDCLSHTGQRPVEWLLDHHKVDARWCLIHATHMTETETSDLAKTGAGVSICPTTEANLGDGFFPLGDFLAAEGRISVGSDSNCLIDPWEEIRWLEYGARLVARQRNIAARPDEPHTGTALFREIQQGGAQALGQKTGSLTVGQRADIVVLDKAGSLLRQVPEDSILDAMIFSGGRADVKHVMVAGTWCISDGHHPDEEKIIANYERTLANLT
ncbi:MAG: formimidoylglutamate deiminase [Rhodobacteraceae bacterium]|nr:formimidoylglutamate deiminase [Paracoccaceae bacterium]